MSLIHDVGSAWLAVKVVCSLGLWLGHNSIATDLMGLSSAGLFTLYKIVAFSI